MPRILHPLAQNWLLHLLLGSVLLWLAFPPVGWCYLVWVAPVFWLHSITRPTLPGKRPYCRLWLAGCLFWLLAVHWIRLPHPLNYFGWVVLATYLGCYLPLFVALARVGVQRGWPLWLVAPTVWTGLDWLRGHLLSGFLMGSLAHTQVGHPSMLQLAAYCGEYGVTFLIVLVAACITQTGVRWRSSQAPLSQRPFASRANLSDQRERASVFRAVARCGWRPPVQAGGRLCRPGWASIIPAVVALLFAGSIAYFGGPPRAGQATPGPRLALIQGHTLADWKNDLEKQRAIMSEYVQLSWQALQQAAAEKQAVDMVIWPETAFRQSLVTVDPDYQVPATIHPSRLTAGKNELQALVRQLGTAVLVGIDHVRLSAAPQQPEPHIASYNAAVLVDSTGILGIYNKMHRVMFGEYVPWAHWLPILDRLTPITGAIQAGQQPVGMELNQVQYAVNICYETVLPHLIRQHVVTLAEQGQAPQVLVNLTNDAWFWGSSELDMHLACGVLRAVEMRTPLVIAANGGLSASIDAWGHIRQQSQRSQTATLLVTPQLVPRSGVYPSCYAAWGDWFAISCVVCCTVLAIVRWRAWHRPAV